MKRFYERRFAPPFKCSNAWIQNTPAILRDRGVSTRNLNPLTGVCRFLSCLGIRIGRDNEHLHSSSKLNAETLPRSGRLWSSPVYFGDPLESMALERIRSSTSFWLLLTAIILPGGVMSSAARITRCQLKCMLIYNSCQSNTLLSEKTCSFISELAFGF
jgi:hypothetical protein